MKKSIHSSWASLALMIFSTADITAQSTPPADAEDTTNYIALHYSDGTAPSMGLPAVNESLERIGVRVSQVDIPKAARPILHASRSRALREPETNALLEIFQLGRDDLVKEIHAAGRKPTLPAGGHLQTSEVNIPPYPKVYDMKALDDALVVFLQNKFGRLHVNRSESGVGIDEVMTIVSGGPYTWFFVLENDVVGKLRLGTVDAEGKAWRISYPGLVPHGGYFDASDGLVVAHAHGPKQFVMRYEDPGMKGHRTLGDNPWIDFSADVPRLLNSPIPSSESESPVLLP